MTDQPFNAAFSGSYSAMCNRLETAADSPWRVHETALARAAAGETIYLLSVGDPDLPTLPSTLRAAIDSLEKGRTHYSPGRGEPHLRQTIAEIEQRASGKPCDPDDVVIFPGATNALYATLACLANPGDTVVVAEPMYVGYQGLFQALGLTAKRVPMHASTAGFQLSAEQLLGAVDNRTRCVLLNTPGNPAGNVMRAEDLAHIAAECYARNLWVVCDEVYSMLTFDTPHVSLRRAAEHLDNVIVIDGLSKSHAMTGWRLGWTVSNQDVADRLLACAPDEPIDEANSSSPSRRHVHAGRREHERSGRQRIR